MSLLWLKNEAQNKMFRSDWAVRLNLCAQCTVVSLFIHSCIHLQEALYLGQGFGGSGAHSRYTELKNMMPVHVFTQSFTPRAARPPTNMFLGCEARESGGNPCGHSKSMWNFTQTVNSAQDQIGDLEMWSSNVTHDITIPISNIINLMGHDVF